MTSNLGNSNLVRKQRTGDPMAIYDGLPAALRQWLAEAALPWSPTSARRIWVRARAKGLSCEEALQMLNRAEAKTLAGQNA